MGKPLVILTGPTAVGKTALSIKLAKRINGEIISADSMQVYKRMNIGSAKIMPEEMEGVPHHLIDILEPWEEFNVVFFQQKVYEAMDEIYSRGHIPILAGGTGFYIQAILNEIDFTETDSDDGYRRQLEEMAKVTEPEVMHAMLEEVDPEAAKQIHPNNVKRVIRALEFYHQTGSPISAHNEEQKKKEPAYNFAYFVLNMDRGKLYTRIEERIDIMMEQGLVKEVEGLKSEGCHKDMVSMKGLGYKEILDYLDGNTSLEEAVAILKQGTRRFAKRQLTWFRREPEVIWFDKEEYEYKDDLILEAMIKELQNRGIL